MTWTPERQTINQRVQIGAESLTALGTTVAAGKLLQCFDWQFAINGDINQYTPTGYKYPAIQIENTEWVDITLGGNLDYNGLLYPLAGVMGAVAPTSHGSSSIAKDWVFAPPITGSIVPQTYTLEQGDASRAHRVSYGLFTEFGYTGTRKQFSCSGKMLAQPIADGITMTASPSAVALSPVAAKQVSVFLDTSSSALGTTQLTRVLSVTYLMTNVYGPLWALNRSTAGWTAHVDLMPQATMKLKLEANSNGMALLGYLQSGVTLFLRTTGQGPVLDNNQTVTIGGSPTGGTFTLTYKGQTTSGIAYNAASSAVQSAIQGLSTVGAGNATVAGSSGGPYTVTFAGALANDTTAMTASGASLTGGTSPTATVTQTQAYNSFTHDMAIKVGKPTVFADDQGVFANEWECFIVEDANWGNSQILTVTNGLTAL